MRTSSGHPTRKKSRVRGSRTKPGRTLLRCFRVGVGRAGQRDRSSSTWASRIKLCRADGVGGQREDFGKG